MLPAKILSSNGRSFRLLTALLILALGLGLLPEQCAGLECKTSGGFSSRGKELGKRRSGRRSCPAELPFCYNYKSDHTPTRTFESWNCVDEEASECFQDKGFGAVGCYVVSRPPSSEETEKGECMKKFVNSVAGINEPQRTSKGELFEKLCLCQTDLCNDASSTTGIVPREKTESTTEKRVTVTEGETPETTTRRPGKRRKNIGRATRWVLYVGIVFVIFFVLVSCYLLLYQYKKKLCSCGRRK